MDIILLESLNKLGKAGEIVTVKDGFAKNFLIPEKKAIIANKKNKADLENRITQINSNNDKKTLDDSWELIARECSQQSHVMCHFDFEFRNLMLLEKNEIGILDFQDLCLGPYAIDLVSILKDIENPLSHEDLLNYLQFYMEDIKGNKSEKLKLSDLEKDIDFAGFQRQFRILGTLSRLHLRDKKSFRLKDLKQTLRFLQVDLAKYASLKELANFLTEKVEPKLIKTLRNIQ